ncbi:MAG: hypothetical protein QOH06_863 [Acidobacteriota bacterium]|jgi:rhombotail lipoprotein|nr:hypothetical protein [Acidobacteriota bacterium]
MRHRRFLLWIGLPLLVVAAGCTGTLPASRRVNSALEFLYPQGSLPGRTDRGVVLHLPVRVGVAFAPSPQMDPITEEQKQRLLNRVAAAFREREAIGHLEVVPSAYLQAGGGFANLDQIRGSLGLDLMVLLSYDQSQFTESTRASWTYLTVVGPFLIEGEKNDTRTVIDAVVYDIESRTLLFRAAGESTVKGHSSPLNVARKRRVFAGEGFEKATGGLITSLSTALARFEEQARTGTIQGPRTPAIAMYDAKGQQVTAAGGGGALGMPELIVVALLGLSLLVRRPE